MEEPMFQEYFARKNSGVWSLYYVRLLGAFVLMRGSTGLFQVFLGIQLSHKAKVKLGSPANMHVSWWQPVLPMSSKTLDMQKVMEIQPIMPAHYPP